MLAEGVDEEFDVVAVDEEEVGGGGVGELEAFVWVGGWVGWLGGLGGLGGGERGGLNVLLHTRGGWVGGGERGGLNVLLCARGEWVGGCRVQQLNQTVFFSSIPPPPPHRQTTLWVGGWVGGWKDLPAGSQATCFPPRRVHSSFSPH